MNNDKLRQILDTAEGRWGMVVKPVGEPAVFERNADMEFRAASVNKIPVALFFLHLVQEEKMGLEQRFTLDEKTFQRGSGILRRFWPGLQPNLEDLLMLMLTVSDNTAAEILVAMFGAGAINQYLESLGFTKTRFDIKPHDYSFGVTTPREMSLMLEGIYTAQYLNIDYSELLLGFMKECENQFGIKRLLPEDRPDRQKLQIANKGGAGDHVRNDVGIVYAERPYIITVFGNDLPYHPYKPDHPGWLTIASLSKEVYAQLK